MPEKQKKTALVPCVEDAQNADGLVPLAKEEFQGAIEASKQHSHQVLWTADEFWDIVWARPA